MADINADIKTLENTFNSFGFTVQNIESRAGGNIRYEIEGNKIPAGKCISAIAPAGVTVEGLSRWIRKELVM